MCGCGCGCVRVYGCMCDSVLGDIKSTSCFYVHMFYCRYAYLIYLFSLFCVLFFFLNICSIIIFLMLGQILTCHGPMVKYLIWVRGIVHSR